MDGAVRSRPSRRIDRSDVAAVSILAGIAILFFAVPTALGWPLMPTDALIQNYPLRVLSGDLLAAGELPQWNQWIWSGTPLLGGSNAGSLYPTTFLFAVLPPLVAWATNEIVLYVIAAVGLYTLLRMHRLLPIAAALGAATFSFAGFMAAHLARTGLVQGMAFAPWVLIALERLASREHRRWAWWLLLCTCGGLVLLTGEYRAASNVALVALVYVFALLRETPYRRQLLSAVALSLPVIAALGAAQILPGLDFVDSSQRGDVGYDFFSEGSLPLEHLFLQVLPYAVGGYSSGTLALWHMPSYSGTPRLPGMTGYVGLLPLLALCTLPSWRDARYRRLATWLALIGVGLILALGASTPLGYLLAEIPLYGSQRYQSRNLALVDLGLAGVVACFVDALLRGLWRPIASGWRRTVQRLASLAPMLIVVGLVLTAWLAGRELQDFLRVTEFSPTLFGALGPYFVLATIVAGVFVVLVTTFHRLGPRRLGHALIAVVVLDLGLTAMAQGWGLVEASVVESPRPAAARLRAALVDGGRVAVYDPEERVRSAQVALASALTPDLTVLAPMPSVQGYGSVVDAEYDRRTDAHRRRNLRPGAVGRATVDQLDLRLLLVAESYLVKTPGLALDRRLRRQLVAPQWEPAGRYGDFLAFRNTMAMGPAWVVARDAGSAIGPVVDEATVEITRTGLQDDDTFRVRTPRPALVVRSVAYGDGWTARVRSADGTEREVAVRRLGLVQAVTVPAGTSTVEWSYRAPGLDRGLVLTLGGLAVLLVVASVGVARERRRRRTTEDRPDLAPGPVTP